MRILVIGGGGREHALIWKLKQSPRNPEVFCAPGNAGIAGLATCLDISASDIDGLLKFATSNRVDLTVVGPEAPLASGLVDSFKAAGLRAFGPCQGAARIESSKAFAKEVMAAAGVPTARCKSFSRVGEALAYVRQQTPPIVVKADGLAAGKGVVVAETLEDAEAAVTAMLGAGAYGSAGERVLIEDYLRGREVTVMAFSDGETVLLMPAAQDHKRAYDGNVGPNTGGMGAYAPVPWMTADDMAQVERVIIRPVLAELRRRGIMYKGVLYAGLMFTDEGPKVVEFNARFGDPETQVVLPLLETDLVDVLEAVVDGRLEEVVPKWKNESAVCVALCAGGYPGGYRKGDVIQGLQPAPSGVMVFHAGTKSAGGEPLTNGGRVVGVTALGKDLVSARTLAYAALKRISFAGMHYRGDIGW
jgi:phosphoribosylamine--glycine ligase